MSKDKAHEVMINEILFMKALTKFGKYNPCFMNTVNLGCSSELNPHSFDSNYFTHIFWTNTLDYPLVMGVIP